MIDMTGMHKTALQVTITDSDNGIYIENAPVYQDERTTKYWVRDDEGDMVELWQIVNDADSGARR